MSFFEVFRAIAALLITIGLLAGFAYLAKRYGWLSGNFTMQNTEKRIKIIEQTFLDAKGSRLMIVAIDGEEQLLMIAPNGAKILKDLGKSKTKPEVAAITPLRGRSEQA